MSTAKMRIKMGPIEIDYEGTEDFLKQELPAILNAISTLYKDSGITGSDSSPVGSAPAVGGSTQFVSSGISVTTIAAKLSAKSGPDLILAAAARLTRGGSASFARHKILEEMKAATGFYKATFSKNLSNYLLSLVKDGKLQETAKDTYSLSVGAKSEIEKKLVG